MTNMSTFECIVSRFSKTKLWLSIDKLSSFTKDFIRSNGNPRCCDLYSNYGLCCSLPFGMATLMLVVLKRTLCHKWLSWNLPMFLFRVGLFTLMKIDSLINLMMSCPSLPIMLKLSWLSWCPVSWLCAWMGEGSLRCFLYISPGS